MKYEKGTIRSILQVGLIVLTAVTAAAQENAVTPGELIQERPTLNSLGVEWRIDGDANGNATAEVRYRKKGAAEWKEGMPLFRTGLGLRIQSTMISRGMFYVLPDALSGSVFDLEPGTEYELRLELIDPDGVLVHSGASPEGRAEPPAQPRRPRQVGVRPTRKSSHIVELMLRTRPEPKIPANPVEIRHVYPPTYQGEKEQPAFLNIMHAVNGYPPVCDTYQTIHSKAAKPGTVIKVHGGLHKYDNNRYWNWDKSNNLPMGPQASYWLHGMITLVANGTPEQPIYIVAAGDGEPIIDGDGAAFLFNVRSADYLHFEGLTIRNTDMAFWGGFQGERGGGCKGLTVKNCWIEDVVTGIMAQDGRSTDFTITDNVILGRNPHGQFNVFGRTIAGYAVNLSGQGHTVAHNYAARFWDGINIFTSAIADPEYGQQARAIDLLDNEIHNCADQFIEADGGYANLRIMRNRMFNCSSQPLSNQPVHAGPVYWVRNIIWNSNGGKFCVKTHTAAPAYVFVHNTASAHMTMPFTGRLPHDKISWRVHNNVTLGTKSYEEVTRLLDGPANERHRSSHNAYRADMPKAKWTAGEESFATLEELQAATGLEKHSLLVDYSVFEHADEPPVNLGDKRFVYPSEADLTPAEDGALVDAGLVIPGVNDDFIGAAPDLGAIERGGESPVYGPRTTAYPERLESLRKGEIRAGVL